MDLTEVSLSSSTPFASLHFTLVCTNKGTGSGALVREAKRVLAAPTFSVLAPRLDVPPCISYGSSVPLTPRWCLTTHTQMPHVHPHQRLVLFCPPDWGRNHLSMVPAAFRRGARPGSVAPLLRSHGGGESKRRTSSDGWIPGEGARAPSPGSLPRHGLFFSLALELPEKSFPGYRHCFPRLKHKRRKGKPLPVSGPPT